MSKKLKLGVLVSGSGTNLQAIINACEHNSIDAQVVAVISNTEKAFALERAKKHKIPSFFISNGEHLEPLIINILKEKKVELVCLAGFMKLLSPSFIQEFPKQILNIHPALLPSFPGLHAQKQALEAGVKESGATVHFVDEGCDTGPILLQKSIPVHATDDLESLSQRILKVEHQIYPTAIQKIASASFK